MTTIVHVGQFALCHTCAATPAAVRTFAAPFNRDCRDVDSILAANRYLAELGAAPHRVPPRARRSWLTVTQIMIVCPRTWRPVPTNRSIRAAAFATADLGTNRIGPCPHCGERHPWTMREAYLPESHPRAWGEPATARARRPA